MSIKLPDGAKRSDALTFHPHRLHIVGIDARADGTIADESAPRWQHDEATIHTALTARLMTRDQ